MSFELKKPYTQNEKNVFIDKYNHGDNMRIVETSTALYALEPNETMENDVPIVNPNYEIEQIQKKKEQFNKDFFLTSLGYIRRKVTMKTGETKDFLSDLLSVISLGISSGQAVNIITYKEPDFTKDDVDWETLQEPKIVTAEFIQECFARLSSDFTG